jgi:hypothetical protein
MVGLETHDHAGEKADEHNNHRGFCPDVIDLLNNLGYLLGSKYLQDRQKEENSRGPQIADPADRCPADSGEWPRQ